MSIPSGACLMLEPRAISCETSKPATDNSVAELGLSQLKLSKRFGKQSLLHLIATAIRTNSLFKSLATKLLTHRNGDCN
jgi:hypothetical protein